MKKLSLVIPAKNEERIIVKTITTFYEALEKEKIPHEIIIINDHSTDGTEERLKEISSRFKTVKYFNNYSASGFGNAVKTGLTKFSGDWVAIVMADLSDQPTDLVRYYREMEKGYACVFGSRFIKGGKTIGYPFIKYLLNRAINNLIRLLFLTNYNDTSNAFKLYSRKVIEGISPLKSPHFNLTLEMPLKVIIKKYPFAIIPNSWTNQKETRSNFRIWRVSYQYLSVIISCFWNKSFLRKKD